MFVRISPRHPFRLAFDTLVVEGGGTGEEVAEAVADTAEAVADAVADAVEDIVDAVTPAHGEDLAVTVGGLVVLVETLGVRVAELEALAESAQATASAALSESASAVTAEDVVSIVEDMEPEVVEPPATEENDETDEPPKGTQKSLLWATWPELKARFAAKVSD